MSRILSPFGRATKWRIALIREVVTDTIAWERLCGTRAQKLPPSVLNYWSFGESIGVIDNAVTKAVGRAWRRIEARPDYDAIYERYKDQHMAYHRPREWEIVKFRREVEALRREVRELSASDLPEGDNRS